MDCFVGQIEAFAFNYAPMGWIPCDGRELPISNYPALYALLGTTYGGIPSRSFCVPDLRGRVPMGQKPAASATGPGIPSGTKGGAETHALAVTEMPQHAHPAPAVAPHAAPAACRLPLAAAAPNQALSAAAIAPTGQSQAHENMMPSLALTYCICAQGMFPSPS